MICFRTILAIAGGCLLSGCIHVEIFHPDVEGTYHLGAPRTYWAFDGEQRHVQCKVTPVAQETPTWCWAAASEMLLDSQGVELSQSEIVRRAYGDERNAGGKSPLMTAALSGTFTTSGGKKISLEAHRADGPPRNVPELVASIEDGRPFIVDIAYFKEGTKMSPRGPAIGAHSVLAYGVTYKREGNELQIVSLDIIDPSYAFIQEKTPAYSPRQRLSAGDFPSIQGTLGIYRK